MTQATLLRRDAVLPAAPAAAAALIEPALSEVAGEGAEPVSLTLDYGPSARAGEAVTVEALVERATRTLVFAVAKLSAADGKVLATGSAIFRRGEAG